jgi:hypothetical protein
MPFKYISGRWTILPWFSKIKFGTKCIYVEPGKQYDNVKSNGCVHLKHMKVEKLLVTA